MKNAENLTTEELKDVHILINMHILMMQVEKLDHAVQHYEGISKKIAKIIVAREVEENAH